MMQANWQKLWVNLEEFYLTKSFGLKKLKTLPPKWRNEFDTVSEMWETIVLDIQKTINSYFKNFFEYIKFELLKEHHKTAIKAAIFSTFISILYGSLPLNSNVTIQYSAGNGYSFASSFNRENGSYLDKLTPEAIRILALTNIQNIDIKNKKSANDILNIYINGTTNVETIYTKTEIDDLLDSLVLDYESISNELENMVLEQDKELRKYVEKKQLDLFWEPKTEENELSNEIEPTHLGKVENIIFKSPAKPNYDSKTQTAIIDEFENIHLVEKASLVDIPMSEAQGGKEFALSAKGGNDLILFPFEELKDFEIPKENKILKLSKENINEKLIGKASIEESLKFINNPNTKYIIGEQKIFTIFENIPQGWRKENNNYLLLCDDGNIRYLDTLEIFKEVKWESDEPNDKIWYKDICKNRNEDDYFVVLYSRKHPYDYFIKTSSMEIIKQVKWPSDKIGYIATSMNDDSYGDYPNKLIASSLGSEHIIVWNIQNTISMGIDTNLDFRDNKIHCITINNTKDGYIIVHDEDKVTDFKNNSHLDIPSSFKNIISITNSIDAKSYIAVTDDNKIILNDGTVLKDLSNKEYKITGITNTIKNYKETICTFVGVDSNGETNET